MNLEILCTQVQELAREVGRFIYDERLKFTAEDIIHKGKADMVTYVDKTAEKTIVAALRELLHGSGFIAEEGTAQDSGEKYRWVIDPLDGTTNYIHGISPFCVSIGPDGRSGNRDGSCIRNQPQRNVLCLERQQSLFKTEKKFRFRKPQSTADSLIATGFPYYDFSKLDNYLEAMNFFMRNSHGMRRLGSAAADMAYVAAGRFEGFLRTCTAFVGCCCRNHHPKTSRGQSLRFQWWRKIICSAVKMIACNANYFDEFLWDS